MTFRILSVQEDFQAWIARLAPLARANSGAGEG